MLPLSLKNTSNRLLPALLVATVWTCSHLLGLFYQGASLQYIQVSMLEHTTTRAALVLLLTSHCVLVQYLMHSWTTLRFKLALFLLAYGGGLLLFLIPTEWGRLFDQIHDSAFTRSQEPFLVQAIRYGLFFGVMPLVAMWLAFPFNGRTLWLRRRELGAANRKQVDAWLKLKTWTLGRLFVPIGLSILVLLLPLSALEVFSILPTELAEFAWWFWELFLLTALPLWIIGRIRRTWLAYTVGMVSHLMAMVFLVWSLGSEQWDFALLPPGLMLLVTTLLYFTDQLPRRMAPHTLKQAQQTLPSHSKGQAPYRMESILTQISVVTAGLIAIASLQALHRSDNLYTRVTGQPVSLELGKVVDHLRQFSEEHQHQWKHHPELQFDSIYRHSEYQRLIRVPVQLSQEPWWEDDAKALRRLGFQLEATPIPIDFVAPAGFVIQAEVLAIWQLDKDSINNINRQTVGPCRTLKLIDSELNRESVSWVQSLVQQLRPQGIEFHRCTIDSGFHDFFKLSDESIYMVDTPLTSGIASSGHDHLTADFLQGPLQAELIHECITHGVRVRVAKSLSKEMDPWPLVELVPSGEMIDVKFSPTQFSECLATLPRNIHSPFLATNELRQVTFVNRLKFPAEEDLQTVPAKPLKYLACSVAQWRQFCKLWKASGQELPPLKILRLDADQFNQEAAGRPVDPAEMAQRTRRLVDDLLEMELPEGLEILSLQEFENMPADWEWSRCLSGRGIGEIRFDFEGLSPAHIESLVEDSDCQVVVMCYQMNHLGVSIRFRSLPVSIMIDESTFDSDPLFDAIQ